MERDGSVEKPLPGIYWKGGDSNNLSPLSTSHLVLSM